MLNISVVYIVLPFTFCLYVTLRFLIHQRLTDKNISSELPKNIILR